MRLHNTSEGADMNIKINLLNEFMKELQLSGYTERDRYNILIGAINTYEALKIKEKLGVRPFYRNNSYKKT